MAKANPKELATIDSKNWECQKIEGSNIIDSPL